MVSKPVPEIFRSRCWRKFEAGAGDLLKLNREIVLIDTSISIP
jgi:hypothetical protein